MDRCNDLCTKEATGTCALCNALAERDRFLRFWFQGGWLSAGWHTLHAWGVSPLHRRLGFALLFLSGVGLMFWLAWAIPHSKSWSSTVAPFLQTNPSVVVVLIVSLALPLFWLLLWKLPQWQVAAVPEVKDRIDLESKSRQTIAQILGGAALLVGLYFTSQTLRTTQEGQITDRFTKAIAQLGDKNLSVRLEGIYALERIAKDSESDHWSVMEVLTAFVREYSHGKSNALRAWMPILFEKDQWPEDRARSKPPADIQAVLTVIGRRTRTFGNGEMQSLNLRNANLQGADLRGAQLQGARLWGAQLQGWVGTTPGSLP
jgi:hypothetical protein